MVKSRINHLATLIINQEQICLLQKLFQSGVNFEIYLSLKWFLPVPVGGYKVSCQDKTFLRLSPGSNNEVYLSRSIL